MIYRYNDDILGEIRVKTNANAKHIIGRQKNGLIEITVPKGFEMTKLPSIMEDLRSSLRQTTVRAKRPIRENERFKTYSFDAVVVKSTQYSDRLTMGLDNFLLTITVPNNLDFEADFTQIQIKEMLITALRHEARRVLPKRLLQYAEKYGLKVSQVKINRSLTRWGSCSSKKSINLSLFLMLLPEKYINYVLLHELAHTIEMNHSPRYWAFLDELCGYDSKAMSGELRKHHSELYSILKE